MCQSTVIDAIEAAGDMFVRGAAATPTADDAALQAVIAAVNQAALGPVLPQGRSINAIVLACSLEDGHWVMPFAPLVCTFTWQHKSDQVAW